MENGKPSLHQYHSFGGLFYGRRWKPVEKSTPFPDSYWVIPGRLLAGEYPGALEEHTARKKLIGLLHCGVNAILNLTEEGELLDYTPWLREEADDFGLDVEIKRMPIRDFSTPLVVEMMTILNQIDEWLSKGKTVYVHCYGGNWPYRNGGRLLSGKEGNTPSQGFATNCRIAARYTGSLAPLS